MLWHLLELLSLLRLNNILLYSIYHSFRAGIHTNCEIPKLHIYVRLIIFWAHYPSLSISLSLRPLNYYGVV